MIQIDNESFDEDIEHFSFDIFHRIADMDELTKLRMLPRLRSATFYDTGLDDRGLSHVADVSTIDNLNLQNTLISDAGLAHLSRLPRLEHLRLKANRQLTNDCIAHLLRLSAVENLQLHETSIDQRGLDQLAALTNLRDLLVNIEDDNYSFDALLALSARMPGCTILAKGRGEFRRGAFHGSWD